MRTFTVYIDDKQKVSEPLLGLLGFIDYASGYWIKDENNSAIVDELVHALDDIGYKWVIELEYDNVFESGILHFATVEEWSEWYEN